MAKVPYLSNQGYPSAPFISDELQGIDTLYPGGVNLDGSSLERGVHDIDPAQLLGPFVTPGMPIAIVERGSHRGRSGDQGSVQQAYVTKGALPL